MQRRILVFLQPSYCDLGVERCAVWQNAFIKHDFRMVCRVKGSQFVFLRGADIQIDGRNLLADERKVF